MLKLFEDHYELNAPLSPSSPSPEWTTASNDAEPVVDMAAAYLLRQLEDGHAHLRIATALLARRASDLDLAFAHLEATRRALERVAFYASNVELGCDGARDVTAARRRLFKQHRGALKQLRNLYTRHPRYAPAMGDCPALV